MSNPRRLRSPGPPGGFRPPHCPNSACRFFRPDPGWIPRRKGTYVRSSDQARFPRFLCLGCGRIFSSRTFSASYWLRHRRLLAVIAGQSVNGPGLRQMGRILHVSHPTVARHLARAGRHCLLFHRGLRQGHVSEPLVIDGFETFEYSQNFPFHLNLAVGQESWFIRHFTDSPLRRKGSMTPEQRRRREELEVRLGRPDPKAVEKGVLELLRVVAERVGPVEGAMKSVGIPTGSLRRVSTASSGFIDLDSADPMSSADSLGPADTGHPTLGMLRLLLHSDDHPAYRRAVRTLREIDGVQVEHRITSSRERRTASNPLFPVNLTDLLLRHGGANHRRETIAFSKRRQAAIERAAVFVVWRNCIKQRRENKPGGTAAMAAGVLSKVLDWRTIFRRRLFHHEGLLPGVWEDYYRREVRTAILGANQTTHCLTYAF